MIRNRSERLQGGKKSLEGGGRKHNLTSGGRSLHEMEEAHKSTNCSFYIAEKFENFTQTEPQQFMWLVSSTVMVHIWFCF